MTKKKRYRMREIYVTWVDTVVEATSKEEAQIILDCIPRDDSQIEDNKMFQQEELEVVDNNEELTSLDKFDKQRITDELGYQIYEGLTPKTPTQ